MHIKKADTPISGRLDKADTKYNVYDELNTISAKKSHLFLEAALIREHYLQKIADTGRNGGVVNRE